MEEHGIGLCPLHQPAGHLKAREIPQTALTFGGTGGRVPCRGHHHIGILHTLGGVGEQVKLFAILVGEHQHVGGRAVALRADAGHTHPCQQAAYDEAVCHAAAIPDEAELLALQRAPALPDGHQVGQHLAGMGVVSQAVDDRDPGQLGKLFQIALTVGAPDHAVVVAAQHPGGILEGSPRPDCSSVAAFM